MTTPQTESEDGRADAMDAAKSEDQVVPATHPSLPSTSSPVTSNLLLHLPQSALALALGTLWLYFVASLHIDGYLHFYHADAWWFSGSIGQLLLFAKWSILYAAGAATLFLWLTLPGAFARKRPWWTWYSVWVLLQSATLSPWALSLDLFGAAGGQPNL